jgi:FkbM family methyltransferase
MAAAHWAHRLGNQLYRFAFPLYRPVYGVYKGYTDRAERDLLARHLFPGAVAVDVGANIGTYSEFLSRCVGPNGTVYSFEADERNFARLYAAATRNPNIRPNQMIVSDRSGQAELYLSPDLNVDHRAYPTTGESRVKIVVESVALDDYFEPGRKVDIIKMDVQGFELQALRGARRLLDENRAVKMLLEFWPYGLQQAGTSAEEFTSFLRDRDFSLFIQDKNGLTECECPRLDRSDPASYCNLFAQRMQGEKMSTFGIDDP